MKIRYLSFTTCASLLLAGAVQAGSMYCGDVLVTDDQPDPQLQEQILAQCGQPTTQDGDDWIYNRSDMGEGTYILHFNASGELDSIEQQTEE